MLPQGYDPIRVAILGTGQMGSGIARVVLRKQGLALVGVYARRKERAGLEVGQAMKLGRNLGIPVCNDLVAMLAESRPHVAIQATGSRVIDVVAEIFTLIRHGIHVISIAEEMAYPACSSPEVSVELRKLATANGVAVLGTGINPGFVLDLLVITLTGVCADVQSITATRVNDLSPYGPSVLRSQGVGLTPEAFQRGLQEGSVVGHIGFPQSLHMIAAALGWSISRVEETREPIISQVQRKTPFATAEPGQVAGCKHTAIAYWQGAPLITLIHPQQIHPQLEGVATGDMIEIVGTPNVRLAGSPEISGGQGTAALAVNMIPRLLAAAPGLYCMANLPVPAAILGDARTLLRGMVPEPDHA